MPFLQAKSYKLKAASGFTLVELLVTVGVTALLASYMVLYGSVSRQQVALSIETAKLAQVISRAKSLSISTFSGGPASLCGYGVHFDYGSQQYSLGNYELEPDCYSVYRGEVPGLGAYSPLETYNMTPEVSIRNASSNSMTDVIFIPPDPKVVTNIEGVVSSRAAGAVYLRTADGLVQKIVNVNASGQITF